jgi:IclR family transcriptional regulator, acetate operon repressor
VSRREVSQVSGGQGDETTREVESHEPRANTKGQYWVRAVDRTVQLLEVVADDGGSGKALAEIARRVAMPEPSALRYLSTLVSRGLLEREGKGEQGRYRLGVGLFVLAEQAVGNLDMRVLALPHMRWLVERYEETVNLAVFRQAVLVIIEVLEGTRSIRQGARVGQQEQLRSTALGKAILATFSDEEALSLLSVEVLEKSTPRTINTDEGMLRELRAIRSRGYAVDNEEHEVGLRCVAVAIPYRGQSFGLSMSGPSHLFSREVVREAGPALCRVGAELATRVNSQRNVGQVRRS